MIRINHKLIINLFGVLLLFNSAFIFVSTLVSLYFNDGVTLGFFYAGLIVSFVGFILFFSTRKYNQQIQKKEVYIIVSFGWLLMICSGMLPYIFTDSIPQISFAFFETSSGYTATGSTVINNVEDLPASILFWRSTTHWIGGMGIIVLAVAILPLLGIGGMQLFSAEAPGPNGSKLHPRITDTAKRLWYIYVGLTFAETSLLTFAGMDFFDAINNSMSTIATGGFSTKNVSIAYWNNSPLIQYIIIFFMFISGANFVLSYFALKGKINRFLNDEEFKVYFIFVLISVLVVATVLFFNVDLTNSKFDHPQIYGRLESSIRHALFQVIAIITTTGLVTGDFSGWTPFLTVFFFCLMFVGGSSGSTSGGIKIVRHLLMIKSGFLELKRSLHPSVIIKPRYNGSILEQNIIHNIYSFFILYILLFIFGALFFTVIGLDFKSAFGVSVASLGNVGPAIGDYGPSFTYSSLPKLGKYMASFLMIFGRLELFTFLVIFTPYFWKNR
jgi:trk system potassium uptake protein TrkH|tara:strand:- start:1912 stop:3408 length:1497 start_codon:yes stop_codon:yes gene_type:complete